MDDLYIRKVLSGDTEAFQYFLKNYQDMAFNVAVSIIKDDQYAEEVVQDAFMKAFRGLSSFNQTATFKSWFYRIVVNESFQRLKKIKRTASWSAIDETNEPASPAESNESGEVDRVRQAMRKLPPKDSLALTLFYLEEYSLKEVSDITGWSLANTKVILHRARKSLRAALGL